MSVSVSGSSTVTRLVQSLNALFPTVFSTVPLAYTLVSPVQLTNALCPTLVML